MAKAVKSAAADVIRRSCGPPAGPLATASALEAVPAAAWSSRRNDALLSSAAAMQRGATARLRDGLATVEGSRAVAAAAAATLAADRVKVARVAHALEELDSEASMARRMVVGLAKRLSSDRVFLTLTLLVLLSAVALASYALANPAQAAAVFGGGGGGPPPAPPLAGA